MKLNAIFLEQSHPCTLSDHKTYLHAIATNHDEWVTNRDHNSWWLDRPPVNGCQESILDRPNQFLTPSSNRSNNNLNPYHQNQYINRDATKNRKFYDFVPNCTPFRNPLFGEEMCFFVQRNTFGLHNSMIPTILANQRHGQSGMYSMKDWQWLIQIMGFYTTVIERESEGIFSNNKVCFFTFVSISSTYPSKLVGWSLCPSVGQ